MSKAIIGMCVAVLIFGGMSAHAQTAKSKELKVLDRFVGSWRNESVEKQANGDEKKSTETEIAKWSLQDRYVESRLTDSDGKQTALNLITYDSEARVYKNWTFFPNLPRPMTSTLRWNESKKTFKGEGAVGNGVTMKIDIRFIGNDRQEATATFKDASGNVVGEFKLKAIRKK